MSITISKSNDNQNIEIEVLKCILCREEYLKKLNLLAKTVQTKFKPEVADLLDLLRVSSVDTVEAILKWREAKGDHDAIFVWNDTNYLLRMPSDLDYLNDYKAIRKWMGFPLIRNPFCVPFPLEEGVELFSDKVLNPQHLSNDNSNIEGFTIGGLTNNKLKHKYSPPIKKDIKLSSPYLSISLSSKLISNFNNSLSSNSNSLTSSSLKIEKSLTNDINHNMKHIKVKRKNSLGSAQSFVLNSDMIKIRQAELIILKEEEKHGQFSKDPQGRLMPRLQASSRKAHIELKKDDYRPIDQPSKTLTHAPHAVTSDIKIEEESWIPNESLENKNYFESEYLDHVDNTVIPFKRGERKIGGLLSPSTTKSVEETHNRRPLKPNLAGEIEFSRNRKKNNIIEQIDEIKRLKDELNEKIKTELIENNNSTIPLIENKTSNSKTMSRPTSQQNTRPNTRQSTNPYNDKTNKKINKIKTTISNNISTVPNKSNDTTGDSNKSKNFNYFDSSKLISVKNLAKKELNDKLKQLNEDEINISNDLQHITKDEDKIYKLKQSERQLNNIEKSRQIERKRRLLTYDQSKRLVPIDDPPNIYDYYVSRIQSLVRGFLGRIYTKWYREFSFKAIIIIQKCIRGWLGRVKVRRQRLHDRMAINIQRSYRGWKSRGVSAAFAKKRDLVKSAVLIQKTWRRILGKRRVDSKRALDKSALEAMKSVDPNNLSSNDVRELGKRIADALSEWQSIPLPPDEVLYALRITAIIVQGARGSMGFASYDFINKRFFKDVNGETMTWTEAGKLCDRAERLLHVIRALSYGPTSKPPRLLLIPKSALALYNALSKNPNWNSNIFANIGRGEKFCNQLFKWLKSLVDVAGRQQEFLSFIASNFPDWLPKLYEIQSLKRKIEYNIVYYNKTIKVLNEFIQSIENQDNTIIKIIEKDIRLLQKEIEENESQLSAFNKEEIQIKNDQINRELIAKTAFEQKFIYAKTDYDKLLVLFEKNNRAATLGNMAIAATLPELRMKIANQKMILEEMETQMKLLIIQCDKNEERRSNNAALPPAIKALINAAGEGNAYYIISQSKSKLTLQNAGVKNARYLPDELIETYKKDHQEVKRLKEESSRLNQSANNARLAFDDNRYSKMLEMQNNDNLSKDQMIPSEVQLQEERLEDDEEAIHERYKKLQYVSDDLLYGDSKTKRLRPCIVILSRDLSSYSKKKILQQLSILFPGVFIPVDIESNVNLGFDLNAMQQILDSNKNIIISIDIGLTYTSRLLFLESLKMVVNALIPQPYIAIATGSEYNQGNFHYGVSNTDINIMKDGDIKKNYELLSSLCYSFTKSTIVNEMILVSEQLVPPNPYIVIVLEAFLMILHSQTNQSIRRNSQLHDGITARKKSVFNNNNNQFKGNMLNSPNHTVTAATWRISQKHLKDPKLIFDLIKSLKYGNNENNCLIELLTSLEQYANHPNWLSKVSPIRINSDLMNVMASYVEIYLQTEKLILSRGGIPTMPLSKVSFDNICTCVSIHDSVDPEDLLIDGSSMIYFQDKLLSNQPSNINSNKLPEHLHDVVKQSDKSQSSILHGWRSGTIKLSRVILQDLRVYQSANKLDDILFQISIYREEDRLYFEAYDPLSSECYFSMINTSEIPSLLAPNAWGMEIAEKKKENNLINISTSDAIVANDVGDNKSKNEIISSNINDTKTDSNVDKSNDIFNYAKLNLHKTIIKSSNKSTESNEGITPPKTINEMYYRLSKLLKFTLPMNTSNRLIQRKSLYCGRDYTFLSRYIIRLDGYRGFLNCYEAALGELYFTIYIPDYSILLDAKLTLNKRLQLYEKCHSYEKELFHSSDARVLLPFMIDRLRISPSHTMAKVRGLNDINDKRITLANMKKGIVSKTSIIKSTNIPNRLLVSQSSNQSNYNIDKHIGMLPIPSDVSKGLKLIIRYTGSIGKVLITTTVKYLNVLHVITIRRCYFDNSIFITVYEPIRQSIYNLTISSYIRRMILGFNDDNISIWYRNLMKRLKLLWNETHSLSLDMTLTKGILKLYNSNEFIQISILLLNDNEIIIVLTNLSKSLVYEAIVSKDDIIRMIYYQLPSDIIEKKLRVQLKSPVKRVINTQAVKYSQSNRSSPSNNTSNVSPITSPVSSPYNTPNRSPNRSTRSISPSKSNRKTIIRKPSKNEVLADVITAKQESVLPISESIVNQIIDPELFNQSFDSVVLNYDLLNNLLINLSYILLYNNTSNTYEIKQPIKLAFHSKLNDIRRLDTSIRHETKLKKISIKTLDLLNQRIEYLNQIDREIEEEINIMKYNKLEDTIDSKIDSKVDSPLSNEATLVVTVSGKHIDKAKAISTNVTTSNTFSSDNKSNESMKPLEQISYSTPISLSSIACFVVIQQRKQLDIINIENELNQLVYEKSKTIINVANKNSLLNSQLNSYITSLNKPTTAMITLNNTINNNVSSFLYDSNKNEELEYELQKEIDKQENQIIKIIQNGVLLSMNHIYDQLFSHPKVLNLLAERNYHGYAQSLLLHQKQRELTGNDTKVLMLSADGKSIYEIDKHLIPQSVYEIIKLGEILVYEGGVKALFREGKTRWSGHVSIQVYESTCWTINEGIGRRYRYVVYESDTSSYYEGLIRNTKHLKEILGPYGQDLLDKSKTIEMLIHIAKYRLEIVKINTRSNDDDNNKSSGPIYRIDFVSDRLYDSSKITPVNIGGEDDYEINKTKLIELEQLRGLKLLRMVRRINGLLIQLTVFETSSKSNQDSSEPNSNRNKPINENGLTLYDPPSLRIIGYDPRTKRKAICMALPEAIIEVIGGKYSPFLHPDNRKELAKTVCESLILYFPRGISNEYELLIRWSGSHRNINDSNILLNTLNKSTYRSNEEKVLKRPNRLFRSAIKINKYECVVTVFLYVVKPNDTSINKTINNVIVNVYSKISSDSNEIVINEQDQTIRLGKPIMDFPEGIIRSTAIRRLCRFLYVTLEEDLKDNAKQILTLKLLPVNKGYLTEYQSIESSPHVSKDPRPVGLPTAFIPLDVVGHFLHRRGAQLPNRDKKLLPKDCIVTLYTKSTEEPVENGIVVKVYERGTADYSVLHIGKSQLIQLFESKNEPNIIIDLIKAREDADLNELDEYEKEFYNVTEKGDNIVKYNQLLSYFIDVIILDLGVWNTPDLKFIPYLRSCGHGIAPV